LESKASNSGGDVAAGPILDVPGSDSEKAIVFFSAMGVGNRRFHFLDVSQYATYNRIFVRDVFDVWYHKGLVGETGNIEETTDLLREMITRRGFRKVTFVGTSAGGFAAILFGALLGIDVVHAFSPRTFLGIRLRLRHRDFRSHRSLMRLYSLPKPNRVLDLKPILVESDGRTRYFLHFCLESRLDRIHAFHLEQNDRINLFPYPCGGHLVAKHLREQEALSQILEIEELEQMTKIHSTLA